MSDDLLKQLTCIDYEDYGTLQVSSVESKDRDLLILLDVIADEGPEIPKNIRLTCHSVRESNLAPGYYENLTIANDHVLLWHYTQPYALTSFYGSAADPLALVGALFERHVDLVGNWIPFQKYLNSDLRLSELIGGSFGMLANGPEQLIFAYEEVMRAHGVSTSHHKSARPLDASLSVIIFDESYVIAERLEANGI
jgi:hypothetical protein